MRLMRIAAWIPILSASWMGACGADGVQEGEDYVVSNAENAALDGGHGEHSPDARGCDRSFESSFAAIQELVFERHGCTASACHGAAKVGGLDLRAEASWESLVDVPSVNSKLMRIQPGTTGESYLYHKLQAATHPGSVQVAGSPMPIGTPPLSQNELDAVGLWIVKGAPKTGSVGDATKNLDVGKLLDACLPELAPVKIKPLDPPPPSEGVQIPLPKYVLKANSEVELCTPFVYDFTKQVPAAFKDEARNVMYVGSSRIRQDPQSHHLTIWNPRTDLSGLSAEGWTCNGGAREGQPCEPAKGSSDCGAGGVCVGKTTPGTFCGGGEVAANEPAATPDAGGEKSPGKQLEALLKGVLTALTRGGAAMPEMLANTQSPQEHIPPMDGVYWEIPLRGVMWFNSHAFNLTNADTVLESRLNFHFAGKRERAMVQNTEVSKIQAGAGTPPFKRRTVCGKHVVPQGYGLAFMTGHTHRRGERFWVKDPSGKLIYESFDYNDPLYKKFEPWLTFDAPSRAARTLEYCALYNNGLTKDDEPDLDLVTRASRMPERTRCKPIACVAGRVTASCKTDRDCDSAPGANDGDCDACAITAGATTENEMFALASWYVLPPKSTSTLPAK